MRLGLLEVAAVTGWGKGGRRPFEPVAPTLQDKASVPVDKTLLPEHPLCRGTAALRQGLAGSALPEPEPKSASCGASAVGLSQVPLNAFAPCSRATPPKLRTASCTSPQGKPAHFLSTIRPCPSRACDRLPAPPHRSSDSNAPPTHLFQWTPSLTPKRASCPRLKGKMPKEAALLPPSP